MLESQINLTDVAHALEIVRDSDSPTSGVDNVILELGKYFAEIRKPEVLFEMWSLDKLSWSKFVLRYDNEDKLKEDFLVPNVSTPGWVGGWWLIGVGKFITICFPSPLCRTCIIFVMNRH